MKLDYLCVCSIKSHTETLKDDGFVILDFERQPDDNLAHMHENLKMYGRARSRVFYLVVFL